MGGCGTYASISSQAIHCMAVFAEFQMQYVLRLLSLCIGSPNLEWGLPDWSSDSPEIGVESITWILSICIGEICVDLVEGLFPWNVAPEFDTNVGVFVILSELTFVIVSGIRNTIRLVWCSFENGFRQWWIWILFGSLQYPFGLRLDMWLWSSDKY